MIKCHYSISPTLQRRIYYLIKQPKYAFIHYRQILQKKRKDFSLSNIKIITYSPEFIFEDCSNITMLIVIETALSNNYLINNLSKITIGFGQINVPAQLTSLNVLECKIPSQKSCEIILNIRLDGKKISFYNSFRSFKYISNNQLNCNFFSFSNQSNIITKKNCPIFLLTEEDLQKRIISLVNHLKLEIGFFYNSTLDNTLEENEIDISQIENDFNEQNFNQVISKLYNELNNISKIHQFNLVDEYGYNLLHYVCCLNLSNTLKLLNYYKISLETKSTDNLTAYEICAGKRNLACLEILINIIDNYDNNEENECFDMKEKCLYDVDVLQSALNLSLEKKHIDLCDIKVLDLLIKQIKINYTVDSSKIYLY